MILKEFMKLFLEVAYYLRAVVHYTTGYLFNVSHI